MSATVKLRTCLTWCFVIIQFRWNNQWKIQEASRDITTSIWCWGCTKARGCSKTWTQLCYSSQGPVWRQVKNFAGLSHQSCTIWIFTCTMHLPQTLKISYCLYSSVNHGVQFGIGLKFLWVFRWLWAGTWLLGLSRYADRSKVLQLWYAAIAIIMFVRLVFHIMDEGCSCNHENSSSTYLRGTVSGTPFCLLCMYCSNCL